MSTGYKVWRPSNPHGYVAPEFDENGLLLNADSDKEDQPRQQGSQQGDLEEGTVEDDKFLNNPDPTHNFLSTPTTKSTVPVDTDHVSIGM